MGYLHANVCFSTLEAAKQAACSGTSGAWGDASGFHTLECTSTTFSGSAMDLCKRTDGGACQSFSQDYPAFPDCDFEASTVLAIDWMMAALLLFVTLFAFKRLIALFSGSDEK